MSLIAAVGLPVFWDARAQSDTTVANTGIKGASWPVYVMRWNLNAPGVLAAGGKYGYVGIINLSTNKVCSADRTGCD